MKKRFYKSALFIVGLIIALLLFGNLLEQIALKVDPNEPKVKAVLALTGKEYNTLILGNSIAQQAFNPQKIDSVTGWSTYNLAIGGASVFTMELLLKNYIVKNDIPERVIYGLYVNEKEWPDKVRPTILYGLPSYIIAGSYATNTDVVNNGSLSIYNRFKVFRYRNVIEHYLKYLIDKERFSYTYQSGFLIKKTVAKPITKHRENMAGANIKALKRLVAFCQAQEINLYFVELPNHKFFNDATKNRPEVLTHLNTISNFKNIYLNLNQPSNYNLEDWASLNHLNYNGANKFSVLFSKAILDSTLE